MMMIDDVFAYRVVVKQTRLRIAAVSSNAVRPVNLVKLTPANDRRLLTL